MTVQCLAEAVPPQLSEETVVTARRVSERLNEVPASVSVYTAADPDALNIDGFDDLCTRVPNLQYYDFNTGLPHFFLRGIGSVNRSGASDAAVGVLLLDGFVLLLDLRIGLRGRPAKCDRTQQNCRHEQVRGHHGLLCAHRPWAASGNNGKTRGLKQRAGSSALATTPPIFSTKMTYKF
jgi:TonB-dependent receptor-like protein